MDPLAEALMRSTLHDLANTLSGVQGILDLHDPGQPLTPRDHARLDNVLGEGMAVLERARHLTLGTFPEQDLEVGVDWRESLKGRLQPLCAMYRCQVSVSHDGDPALDRWPGEALRSFLLALARQLLPMMEQAPLAFLSEARGAEWRIRIPSVSQVPDCLTGGDEARRMDISARWARAMAKHLDLIIGLEQGALLIRMHRPRT